MELPMLSKIWDVILPNLIGLGLMVVGWYISIVNVGISTRLRTYEEITFISTGTLLGLLLIIIGAFVPRIWNKIRGK
jgi:hypothetical protein